MLMLTRLVFASLLALGSLLAPGHAIAGTREPFVVSLSVTGVVDPFLASYVEDGIADAESDGASAVLLRIDTPGGLSSSMREIVQAVLGSRVPVVCFVGPEGARAASAGAFILLACPVAAMAPGTNVGAAHPVGVSGVIESQKAENDAAAYIRSLAERRDRNADWAEDAVRESVSATAEEALELDVIDLVSTGPAEVLADVDGQRVEVAGVEGMVLETSGARIVERPLGAGPAILHALLTPDLAFIFFFLGLLLLAVEVLTPGLTVPGTIGILLLIAAFASFGLLPVTLLGLALIATSAIAFIVDLKVPGTGVATIVGLVTLVLGGAFLFDSRVPNANVSWPTIAAVGLLIGAFSVAVVDRVLRSRRRPVESGMEALVGATGEAVRDLSPVGLVRARGEEWSATSVSGTIPRGAVVRVTGVQGVHLLVERISSIEPAAADAAPKGEASR